jgi:phosphoenolpyruvate carboxylase
MPTESLPETAAFSRVLAREVATLWRTSLISQARKKVEVELEHAALRFHLSFLKCWKVRCLNAATFEKFTSRQGELGAFARSSRA